MWFWNNQYRKAEVHKQSITYLKTKANLQNYFKEYIHILPYHPSKRGYFHDDHMSMNHLIVIIIYCGADVCNNYL